MNRFLRPLTASAVVVLLAIGVWVLRPGRMTAPAANSTPVATSLQLVLTPLPGDEKLDAEIRDLQARIKDAPEPNAFLERLGWAFVAKARTSSDPGFYSLAEQSAKAITDKVPNDPGAALLLGHTYHALHRFAEAEAIGQRLTAEREFVFDYALLGDALMEQGKLGGAVDAYQAMVDLKPCLQTYSRIAHLRWLKGDLSGATEASRLAVSAGSPREPEPTAWALTRLAFYELQANNTDAAHADVAAALQSLPDYAPAELMRGRVFLATGKADEAVTALRAAAEKSPLPEYLWTLAEALHVSGDESDAAQVEAQLAQTGRVSDPRTYALFLATRGEAPGMSLELASAELAGRQDIFSYDALAWAQLRSGALNEARENIARALAEGTQDARLFYHAGAIAAAANQPGDALEFFTKARAQQSTLLPSERDQLGAQLSALASSGQQISNN